MLKISQIVGLTLFSSIVVIVTAVGMSCGLGFGGCGAVQPSTNLVQTAEIVGSGMSGSAAIFRDSTSGANVLRLQSATLGDSVTFLRITGNGGAVDETHQVICTDGNSNINLSENGTVTWETVSFLDNANVAAANVLGTVNF
jgi:hypothetical protein